MFLEEFSAKNPDLKPMGGIVIRWQEVLGLFISQPLSIIPINSTFHNAELYHIAVLSRRRSAYDLQNARGKNKEDPLSENDIHPLGVGPPIFSLFLRHGSYGPIIINLLTTELILGPLTSRFLDPVLETKTDTTVTSFGHFSYIIVSSVKGGSNPPLAGFTDYPPLARTDSDKKNRQSVIKMIESKGQMGLSHPDNSPSTNPTTTSKRDLKAHKSTLFEYVDNCCKKVTLTTIPRKVERRIEPTQEWFRREDETDILSSVIRYEQELGREPELTDLLRRFSRQEIHMMWDSLIWLYPHLENDHAELVMA